MKKKKNTAIDEYIANLLYVGRRLNDLEAKLDIIVNILRNDKGGKKNV